VDDLDGYVRRMRTRYRQASKLEKGRILDEFCAVLCCHRKSAIRTLRRDPEGGPRRPGRPPVYGPEVIGALRTVWEASDHNCGKRLAPQLASLTDALERHQELQLTETIRKQLGKLSASTIDRRLAPQRRQLGRRPHSQSQALSTIQRQVPIRTFGEWTDVTPGQVQVDLVSHCGINPAGSFVVTLTVVDVATSWTECRAALTRRKDLVAGALHVARNRFPFPLKSVHSDNGGEFLNDVVFGYCHREAIASTRGRAYKKNDQAYVEQKNGAVVRRHVGYHRYQSKDARDRLNEFYELLRLYGNFFQSVRKVLRTERIGAKVRKHYDVAATPYQRALAAGVLDEATRTLLADQYQRLNPVRLRKRIAEAVRRVVATAEPRWGMDAVPKSSPSAPLEDGGGKVDSPRPTSPAANGLPTFPPHDAGGAPLPAKRPPTHARNRPHPHSGGSQFGNRILRHHSSFR
jgi:hypothetical protein